MGTTDEIRLTLELEDGYCFRIRFDDTALPDLMTDEPAPLGADAGPNPSRLLLAAIGNCLSASLLFALRKFRNQPGPLTATVHARLERNDSGRWRLPRATVRMQLAEPAATHASLDRVLAQFEQFCVVTQSVRDGIDVAVEIVDADGRVLHGGAQTPS